MPDEPWIHLDTAGRVIDANTAALDLLGFTLAELRAAPPGSLSAAPQSPDEQAAFRQAWEGSGSPDIVGSTTIQRRDGISVRVQFGITARGDGTYLAILRSVDQPTHERRRMYTAGQVLAEWRAAERELEAIEPDSPERSLIEREVDRFKDAYQSLFTTREGGTAG